MVLGAIGSSIQAVVQIITQHKFLAIILSIFLLATMGVAINTFFVGNDYTCETNTVTGAITLYNQEIYSKCLPVYMQGKFYKFNYSKTDCDNSINAVNDAWKETCYSFISEVHKASFLLDTITPFMLFFEDITESMRNMAGGNETKSLDDLYNIAFETNICTKLYKCMPKEKAESIGLFKGCIVAKGSSVPDDFPSYEEFESVARIDVDYTEDNQEFKKENIFKVQCFGLGDEKRPTLSLLGLLPIFDWQFMALLSLLSYWSLFMFWLADKVKL